LCLAGGCAMNSVANGKIRDNTPFKRVYIQPAAGDNGTALGAALEAWHQSGDRAIAPAMQHSYWGTEYAPAAIAEVIRASTVVEQQRCTWTTIDDETELCDQVAASIADGQVIGWFQGRMEWGARALGNRSIVADPRRRDMRDIINQKIKFRERFRPFAPSVLAEAIDEYFVGAVHDPFMIQVYPVRPEKRDVIPAVTHVDGSGRLQSVSRDSNARYWSLIRAFQRRTGVPVVLNTSFNENEPIVEHPRQALDCFLRTDMDVLVMGPHLLRKT
jgi:carbamoyltransferase